MLLLKMSNLSNFLILLLFFTLFKSNFTNDEQNEKKVQEIDEDDATNYLQHYGYWPPSSISRNSINSTSQAENEELLALQEALKQFQESWGLEPTGLLDATTKTKIAQPRCGVPDFDAIGRFRGAPRKWNKLNITYSIINFSEDMSKRTFREVIRKAFDLWSEVISLNFIEIPAISSTADIKIGFATGEHGDWWPFDGKNGTLAHATYPPNGNIHFDDDENWVYLDASKIENETHIDILNIATHEIGHAIGVGHIIKSEDAIMAPVYKPTLDSYGNYLPPKLTTYDVDAARKIYEPRREPYNNGIGILSDDEISDVETTTYIVPAEVTSATTPVETTTYILPITTYIVPTEVISTTTQTEVNSSYECPDWIGYVIASEEVTYIIRLGYLYKIQNQRVVKKGLIGDFFVQWEYYSIEAGYIRNGSLILLDSKKQVLVYDPIPMQSDKFQLREGFPKKTPIDITMNGAIMINDKAHVFGPDGYLIYDEQFNIVTPKMDFKINFPNFPMNHRLYFRGGHTTSFNGQQFLTLFTTDYIITSNHITLGIPQVYTYDLERKNLVGEGKKLTEYLLNCE